MLNREEVQKQHEKKKRLEERNQKLLLCQKKLQELQQEIVEIKSDHSDDFSGRYDLSTLDFSNDDELDEYLKSLLAEEIHEDHIEVEVEEEKKCDGIDVVQYLEGYGVTSDMMDESSLRYLIKEQEDNEKRKQEQPKQESNDSPEDDKKDIDVPKSGFNNDIDTNDELFQETKESLMSFHEEKARQVLDLAEKTDAEGNTRDPNQTIASLQEINEQCETIQMKLWTLCEKQQEAILQTKDKLEKLEGSLQNHRKLILNFHKKYGSLFDGRIDLLTLMEDNLKSQKNFYENTAPMNRNDNNNDNGVEIGNDIVPRRIARVIRLPRRMTRAIAMFKFLFTAFTNTKLYHVLNAAYTDVQAQNINIQIDLTSLMKLVVFLLIFSARAATKSNKQYIDLSFYGRYRHYFLCGLFICIFLIQSGIGIFIYKFLVRDWGKLWRDQQNGVAANDNDPNQRRAQRERAPAVAGINGAQQQPTNLINGAIYQARRDGGVNQGYFHDLKYFVTSFILSLSPMWRPQRIEGPPEQQQPQPQPVARDNDNDDTPVQNENNNE